MISRTDAEKLNNPDAFLEYIGLQSFNFPENLVEVAGIEPETPCAPCIYAGFRLLTRGVD